MSRSVYTVCGVSTDAQGHQRIRCANSLASRVRKLAHSGHTDIRLVEMPFAGGMEDAVDFLLGLDDFRNLECVQATARDLGFIL